MKLPLSALALACTFAALSGCAAPDSANSTTAATEKAPKVYRTGSNIPVKDDTPPMSDADRERVRQEILNQSGLAAQKAAGSK